MACGTVYFGSKLAKAMDKNSLRTSITGACCVPNGDDGVWAVATDARIMAVRLEDGQCDEIVVVPHDLMPTKPADFDNPVEIDGNKIVRTDKAKSGKVTQKIGEPIEGKFPHAGDVLPKLDDTYIHVALDPVLLLNLFEALGEYDNDKALELFIKPPEMINGKQEQHVSSTIAVKRGRNIGVAMPMTPGADKLTEAIGDYNEFADRFRGAWAVARGEQPKLEEPETEETVEDDLPVEIIDVDEPEPEAVTEVPDPGVETTEGSWDEDGDFEEPSFEDDDDDEEDAVLSAEELLAMLT